MKLARRALFVATLLASLANFAIPSRNLVHAARTVTDFSNSGGLGVVKVQGTRVAEVDSSHLRIAIDLVITPSQTATLGDLRLASLRLNGLPAFAEPLTQQIDMVQGKDTALPPIYITVQFRDVTTVAPLREVIEKQSVDVHGQVTAAIKLNFLERLAMHTQNPRVWMTFNEVVPVAVGSATSERKAAVGILSVVELGLRGSAIAHKNIPGLESAWMHELEAQAGVNVVRVATSYKLKDHKTTYAVGFDQLGFRLGTGRMVVTAEATAPWEFDAELLGRMKSGEVKLVKKSTDIELHSIGRQSEPLLLSQQDFSMDARGSANKQGMILQRGDEKDYARINVRLRAAPDGIGVITLKNPPASGGFAIAPAAVAQQQGWDKVAVYRMVQDATGNRSLEVVQLSAKREGQSIHLDEAVDPSFYGSPILVPEGVLGIVQDERAGAFVPADLVMAAGLGATAAR